MDFTELKNILSIQDLPGWKIQKELSPPYRKEYSLDDIQAKKPRIASVLVVLYKKENEFYFPLILRSEYDGTHSGQIALPGGKKDISDNNTVQTALRETNEEIGLDKKKLEIVKKLTPLYIPPSNFYVKPYVAFYNEEEIKFEIDSIEVQKVYEIELYKFLFGMNIVHKKANFNYQEMVPAFQYDDITIWGATAMILNEFKALLKNN